MSDAILGTFVTVKTMADGTPRLMLDMQCTLSELAAMGLEPGAPFGVARLRKEASVTPPVAPTSQPKEKPGPLCVVACIFCADPVFWEWIETCTPFHAENAWDAKDFILDICNIKSRKDIDSNPVTAGIFHNTIRAPFLAWKASEGRRAA